MHVRRPRRTRRISAAGDPAIGLLQGNDCTVRRQPDTRRWKQRARRSSRRVRGGNHVGIARNVTAVGTGAGSTGITSSYSGGDVIGSYTLDARNVIASGAAADLRTGGGAFGVGHFAISNSNFETVKFEPGFDDLGRRQPDRAAPLRQRRGRRLPRGGRVTDDRRRRRRRQLGALDLDGQPAQSSARRPTSAPSRSSRPAVPLLRGGPDPVAEPGAAQIQGGRTRAARSSAPRKRRKRRSGPPSPTRSRRRRRSTFIGRTQAPRPQGRQALREADESQQDEEEVLSLQAA